MPKEKPVRLTLKAKNRLIDIGVYSFENWGVRKRDAYLDGLLKTLELIGKFPLLGYTKPEISKDMRTIKYESHVIYYRIYSRHIGIIDILHHHMNHLKDIH